MAVGVAVVSIVTALQLCRCPIAFSPATTHSSLPVPFVSQDDDPTDDPTDDKVKTVRRHRKSVFQRPDGTVPMQYKPRAAPAPTGSYQAQITKTTDGGATWTTVFNVTNQFYVRRDDRSVGCVCMCICVWVALAAPWCEGRKRTHACASHSSHVGNPSFPRTPHTRSRM